MCAACGIKFSRLVIALLASICSQVFASPCAARYAKNQQIESHSSALHVFTAYEDSVVRVSGVYTREDGSESVRTGSGFFVRGDGHIVTTAGVIDGANEVFIESGNESYGVEVVGVDVQTNLAALRIRDRNCESAPNFFLGNCERLPLPTTKLLAITCEIGLDPTPCAGIVCGQNIDYGSHRFPTSHLRSSIPSNAGAPGSPVFDEDGNFVGILMASISQTNGSFILPARAVRRVLCDMLFCRKVNYAYVGVDANVTRGKSNECIVRVERVEPGSPADMAGILVGDKILAINGHGINSLAELHDSLFFAQPNTAMNLRLARGDEEMHIIVRTICR
jgi:S1-C subfamily serine protease